MADIFEPPYIGTPDPDEMFGTPDGEVFKGFEGADNIFGEGGADTIGGLAGNDMLIGHGGNDVVEGGDGNDALHGYAGDDTLDGGAGNDRLYGGSGDDVLTGGTGEDTFGFDGGVGADTITDFADGIDVIRLKDYGVGGLGDLTVGEENGNTVITLPNGCGTITLESFAMGNLDAGDFDVVGAAGPLSLCLNGSLDADTLSGDAGNDKLIGYGNDDSLDGGAGNDALHGYAGDDTLEGGDGDDRLWGGSDDDRLIGGSGADRFEFSGSIDRDTITDFDDGVDLIAFTGYGVDFGDLICTQVGPGGADAEISGFGGGTITLLGFDCADLDNADFVFG